ncbi:MAG TPA: hypothetical protein VHU86_07855 [Solirubrobacterales bacterium]|jgi:hypothetical protein|nr:hypothetical protein [Solirubrobacterales bacterium]
MPKEKQKMTSHSPLKARLAVLGLALAATALLVAPAAQAAPTTAFNAIAVTGPTNLPPAVNEVQKVAVDATGGGFRLEFGGQQTVPLAFNESAANVQSALNSLPGIGGAGGSVTVTGGPGSAGATNPYLVSFGGSLAATNVAQMTAKSEALTGSGHTAAVTTPSSGGTGTGAIAMYVQNIGGKAAGDPIVGKITLPPGMVTSATPEGRASFESAVIPWSCAPTGAGQSVVTCITDVNLPPGTAGSIEVPLTITRAAGNTSAEIEFSGGGAVEPAKYTLPITISSEKAAPGIAGFSGGAYNDDGTFATQAGGHPYSASASLFATTIRDGHGFIVPAGNPHDILVGVPPGFAPNPRAALRCQPDEDTTTCSGAETIIGTAAPVLNFAARGNLTPAVDSAAPKGYPAGFRFKAVYPEIQVNGQVRSDSDYAIELGSKQTLEDVAVYGSFFTFWGTPADPSHDVQRCPIYNKDSGSSCIAPRSSIFEPTALVTNPTDCQGEAERTPTTSLKFDVWEDIGNYHNASVTLPPVTGCNELEFEGNLSLQPQSTEAAVPSAFDYNVEIPTGGLLEPEGLVTPELKNTTVTLPEGVGLNPAAAAGLGACSLAQMGYLGNGFGEPNPIHFDKAPVSCPENSKLGTVEISSPLLDLPLQGTVYLGAQDANPFNSTIALYLVIEDEQTGLTFKLPGKAIPNPVTGQVVSTFPNNPQLPFEALAIHFKGGNLAPLATPEACGTYATDSEVEPWSAPESGPPFHDHDSFQITQGVGGGNCPTSLAARPFHPSLKIGTTSSAAGAYTGLRVKMSRQDGEQDLSRLSFTLPKGVSGKLAGIPYCSEAQVKQAESQSGKAEEASPACPQASQLGSVIASAGIGSNPYYAHGRLYLTGPYKGAPVSTVAVVPAVAGPYDLGNVVVRTPLFINRQSAQVTATSDPLPYILKGIPLHLRSIEINVDRSNFIVNPTSCEKEKVTARITGSGGDNVSAADDVFSDASEPFQVGGCPALNFKPRFAGKVTGPTRRGGLPAFTATLTYPEGAGYADIKDVQVALPHSEFLEQAHINTVCTRVQAAANSCPAGSIYGYAEAFTPLLDKPLSGPVFLKSSDHKLPDLAIALKGPENQPVEVEFAGRIDSVHGQIRNTIEGLPDVPVSKFVLKMKGGKKGLLVNSRNLCQGKQGRMTVDMTAQNNKTSDARPLLGNSCAEAKKGKKHHKRHQRSRLIGGW